MDTLNGGRAVTVKFEDGSEREIVVGQIKLRQYKAAFDAKGEDDFSFVALATALTKGEVEALNPESYEVVVDLIQEVNAKGFFVSLARQQKEHLERMNNMSPEVLKAAAAAVKASNVTQPGLQPRRA